MFLQIFTCCGFGLLVRSRKLSFLYHVMIWYKKYIYLDRENYNSEILHQ